MTLHELHGVLSSVGIAVSHYEADLDTFPYITFSELSTSYVFASSRAWREITRVGVDHFTKTEWDKTLDDLKLTLLKHKINFTTATVWYANDKLINTQFNLSITREMEV